MEDQLKGRDSGEKGTRIWLFISLTNSLSCRSLEHPLTDACWEAKKRKKVEQQILSLLSLFFKRKILCKRVSECPLEFLFLSKLRYASQHRFVQVRAAVGPSSECWWVRWTDTLKAFIIFGCVWEPRLHGRHHWEHSEAAKSRSRPHLKRVLSDWISSPFL